MFLKSVSLNFSPQKWILPCPECVGLHVCLCACGIILLLFFIFLYTQLWCAAAAVAFANFHGKKSTEHSRQPNGLFDYTHIAMGGGEEGTGSKIQWFERKTRKRFASNGIEKNVYYINLCIRIVFRFPFYCKQKKTTKSQFSAALFFCFMMVFIFRLWNVNFLELHGIRVRVSQPFSSFSFSSFRSVSCSTL